MNFINAGKFPSLKTGQLNMTEKLKAAAEFTFEPPRPFSNAVNFTEFIAQDRHNPIRFIQIDLPEDNAFGLEMLTHNFVMTNSQ